MTGEFPTSGIISTSSKSYIEPLDYVCKFVLAKQFVMLVLLTLDMTSDKLLIDWMYT